MAMKGFPCCCSISLSASVRVFILVIMLDSSFCLVGEGTLLIQCAEVLLARKQGVIAVVSHDQRVLAWCGENEVICFKELHTFELYDTSSWVHSPCLHTVKKIVIVVR